MWRGWWWVDIRVVLPIVVLNVVFLQTVLSVVVVVVPCVVHLKCKCSRDKEYPRRTIVGVKE
jgi:hypothetical protein